MPGSFVRRLAISSVFIVGIGLPTSPAHADEAIPHVRTGEPRIRSLLKAGAMRSNTLRTLLTRLEASDVVVYIRFDSTLPGFVTGKTWFVTSAAGTRYLQIEVMPHDDVVLVTATIAHELAHALEVADDSSIIDTASMTERYLATGAVRTRRNRMFVETEFALKTGARARRELTPHQADLLFASTH